MISDLLGFAVVFLVCILGFGICLRGIFSDVEAFATVGGTFVTMYDAAIGNVDYSFFHGTRPFDTFGTVMMAIFVAMTTIILLNLLIARMSNTHQLISDRSLEEVSASMHDDLSSNRIHPCCANHLLIEIESQWSYAKAGLTKKLINQQEKGNPLCLLPAPLNAISLALSLIECILKWLKILKPDFPLTYIGSHVVFGCVKLH